MRAHHPLATALAVLALGATLAAADGSAMACHNSTSKAECLGKEACVFCQATLVPSGCFFNSEAKLLPGCEPPFFVVCHATPRHARAHNQGF